MLSIILSFALTSEISSQPLQELRQNFKSKSGFEVNFIQEIHQDILADDKELASGHVTFKKPNNLEWNYLQPRPRKIVFNSNGLKIIEGKEVQEIKESQPINLQESFAFLWGEPNPKLFKIETINTSTFRVKPTQSEKAGFKYIDVRVKKGLVESALVKNLLDGESELSFKDWKLK